MNPVSEESSSEKVIYYGFLSVPPVIALILLCKRKGGALANAFVGAFTMTWLGAPLLADAPGAALLFGLSIIGYLGFIIYSRFYRQLLPLAMVTVISGYAGCLASQLQVNISIMVGVCTGIAAIAVGSMWRYFPDISERVMQSCVISLLLIFSLDMKINTGFSRMILQQIQSISKVGPFLNRHLSSPQKDNVEIRYILAGCPAAVVFFYFLHYFIFSVIFLRKKKPARSKEFEILQNGDNPQIQKHSKRRRQRIIEPIIPMDPIYFPETSVPAYSAPYCGDIGFSTQAQTFAINIDQFKADKDVQEDVDALEKYSA